MDREIIPVPVGTVPLDRSYLTYLRHAGETVDATIYIWVIRGGGPLIVVDTGPCTPEWAARHHMPMRQEPHERPERALRAAGVDPEKVEIVVLSHLHWDHCFNNGLFPAARFYVQRKELSYALAPLPIHCRGFEAPATGLTAPYLGVKYDVVDGDLQIASGVSLLLTPGHTPGSQCVLVQTCKGRCLVASDTIPLYENWESGDPLVPHVPNGFHYGLEEYFATFRKLQALDALVIPGHDPEVRKHDRLP